MRPPQPDAPSRRHWIAIVLLALAVRAAVGFMADGNGEMEGLAPAYEENAYALAAGYGFVRPVYGAPPEVVLRPIVDSLAVRGERLTPARAPRLTPARWRPVTLHPPGYAVWGWLLYRIFGPPMTVWARVFQALFDAAACLLVMRIGQRFGGRFAALVAGYGSALFLPLAYLVTSRVADALTPPLVVLAFWTFLQGLDSGRARWWAGTGAVIAALWMLRPDYAPLPAFLLLVAAIARPGFRTRLVPAAAMLLTTAVLVLPWAFRNQRAIGEFTPSATSSGMVLLQSIGMFPNPHGIQLEDGWYDVEAVRAGFESAEDPGAARMFQKRYLAIARRDPMLIARSVAIRLGLGLVPPYHWGWRNTYYDGHSYYDYLAREGLGPLAALKRHPLDILRAYWDRFLFLPIALLLLAGSIACVVLARGARREALLLLAPFAYVVGVHLPLYMTMRMMVPGVFAQLVACACAFQLARGRAALGLPARG